MAFRSNWRGRLLVDMSTGNVSTEKSGQCTSEPFISTSYNPTAAIQQHHEEPPPTHSAAEFVENGDKTMTTLVSVDCFDTITPTLDSVAEPVNYANITILSDEIFSTAPYENQDAAIPSIDTLTVNHESEITSQPLPMEIADSDCTDTAIVGYKTYPYLDEITGELVSRNAVELGTGHFILDEQTGELLEIDEGQDKNHNEFDINEIHDNKRNREFNKKQRVKGKPYMGRKIEVDSENCKKTLCFISKNPKDMKTKTCTHSATESKSPRTFLCGALSEEQREATFRYYWSLDTWDAKKAYVKNLIRLRPIRRRRKATQSANAVKMQGFDCFLPNENNELIRVCKSFMLNTLVMTNDTLNTWVKELHEYKSGSSSAENKPKNPSSKSASVREWLDLLPKVPSHYCRASTSRNYVEDSFRNKTHMFEVYKNWSQENEREAAKRKLFTSILEAEKISIFKPRKDQCDTCTSFKEGNLTLEDYEIHKTKKEEAYKAKTNAQSLCSSEVLVVTMDVQSVLLSPKLQVSVQYYKQKLQIHNYTLYCSNDKDVHLYVWHEGDGGVTANEFTTCLIDFLNIKIDEGYKKMILISDGCCYQNRNKVLSSSLLNLSISKNVEIEQLILEKGHTMMQVDSVHSTLEHLFKPPIYSPNDYINLMAQARPAKPYVVHHLEYKFFKNYERTCQLDSIRPGKKAGDPVVTDIRGLLYRDGEIFFKLRHTDDWQILRKRRLRTNPNPTALYNAPRKIEKSKYDSLQSLKDYMHRDHHYFYDNLKHN